MKIKGSQQARRHERYAYIVHVNVSVLHNHDRLHAVFPIVLRAVLCQWLLLARISSAAACYHLGFRHYCHALRRELQKNCSIRAKRLREETPGG